MYVTGLLGTLKIGDFITLKNLRIEKYVCAEGILQEDVVARETLPSFEDALFCIHLQRQYSASRELEDFLTTYQIDINNIEDGSTSKFLQALKVKRLFTLISKSKSSIFTARKRQ